MQNAYPCVLTPEEGGGFSVSFPDVPEALTCGNDLTDALAMAEEALTAALAIYLHLDEDPPAPSPLRKGQYPVTLPAIGNSDLDTQRMTMQQSVFLFGMPEVEADMIEWEILIPEEHKATLRQELDVMGISDQTLFSDLAGFSNAIPRNRVTTGNLQPITTLKNSGSRRAKAMNSDVISENYFQRANFRAASGKYEQAIADYDRAFELKPRPPAAYYNNRGNAKDGCGRYEEALADYDEAIRLKPQDASFCYNRGVAQEELARYGAAIADYGEAIRLDPQHANAYYNRGNVKAKLGRPEEAIVDYDRATRANPRHASAYFNKGNVKSKLGRYVEAIADYDEALRIDPQHANAYANRGTAYRSQGMHERAMADYDKAVQLNPDNTEHRRWLEKAVQDLARDPQKPGNGLGKEIREGADAQEHKEWDQGTFKERERVVLTTDICGDEGEQLRSGDVGVVVHVHTGGEAYVVEFVALAGGTAAMATVLPSQARPVTGTDLTHARTIEMTV